jgi:capsular polysaccharide biosynthesis protein
VNFSSLLKVLWRHKHVVVPVAVLALIGMVGTYVSAGATYRASSSVVLLNPPALPEITATNPTIPQQYQNPYARFQDLSVIVDILVKVMGNEQIGTTMKAQGLDGTFEIAANRDFYRGPIIDVSAEGTTTEQAIKNANIVVAEMKSQLTELQKVQGTDPSYYIQMNIIQSPSKATRVLSGTLRLLILVGALGVIATVAAGLIADARSRARRRRLEEAFIALTETNAASTMSGDEHAARATSR